MGPEVVFDLTIGTKYAVAAMLLSETTLFFVVVGDHGSPIAVPGGLFEASTKPIPTGWCFSVGPGAKLSGTRLWEKPLVGIWGYREMVTQTDHLDALLEGDPAAVKLFDLRAGSDSFETNPTDRLF